MKKSGRQAFVDNFGRLWAEAKASGASQESFSKAVGVSQKTVSNILNAIDTGRQIRLDTIESVANGLNVEVWQLLVPDLPLDLLRNHRLIRLVDSYKAADKEGRDFIARVAEKESHYSVRAPEDRDAG